MCVLLEGCICLFCSRRVFVELFKGSIFLFVLGGVFCVVFPRPVFLFFSVCVCVCVLLFFLGVYFWGFENMSNNDNLSPF